MLTRITRRVSPALRSAAGALRRGHDGPLMPPFARLAPPTGSLPEEVELVWDDQVAPETCIDFDAPSVSSTEMLQAWACLGAFFATLIGYIVYTDPVGSNPVALRSTVIPFGGLKYELGLGELEEAGDGDATEGEEDEEEDE